MTPPGAFALLLTNFFKRLFESDLLPEGMDLEDGLAWVIPLFAAPAAFVSILLLPKYSVLVHVPVDMFLFASWPDKLFFIGYSMAATGFVTVLIWERVFPDERDALVLGPLPVPAGKILMAKLAALVMFVVGFATTINVPAALAYAFVVAGPRSTMGTFPIYLLAHVVTTVSAGLFVFLALVAVQTTGTLVLPRKMMRAASIVFQFLFVVVLLEWSFFAPRLLEHIAKNVPRLTDLAGQAFLPPLWFLGLYETLVGNGDASRALASRAILASCGAAAVAVAAYGLSYRKIMRGLVEAGQRTPTRDSLVSRASARLTRWLVRDPIERSVIEFTTKSLFRSRRHRLLIAVYLGIAMAFIVGSFVGPILRGETLSSIAPAASLLSVPLVLSFFTLVGLRVVFSIPTELDGNWIFRITESGDQRSYVRGVRKALFGLGTGPLAIVTATGYCIIWGAETALMHSAFWLVLALWLTELLTMGFGKVPFTCSYVPGKANIKLLWPLYLLALSAYAYGAARVELWLLKEPARWATTCAFLLAGLFVFRLYRNIVEPSDRALIYEESIDDAVQEIGL